jgi:4-diphosphocytidyl-2-C-methyl-D-erythritol kinase
MGTIGKSSKIPATMRILSPAKINLHLRVGPLGADGFHPLLSWMCTTGLHDVLEIHHRDEPGVDLKCDRIDVPVDETNLIVRAGRALDEKRGARVTLQKNTPMGGGLGGGSSNAAFALVGFNRIWSLGLPVSRLSEIAASLGSDVPFFLHGPSSVCTSRGENVLPIASPQRKSVVLIFPRISISTPAVYRRFDEMKLGKTSAIQNQPDWSSWSKMPAEETMEMLVNDLEPPAFSLCPQLEVLREQIENRVGRTVRMSGSGSTLFTLVDDGAEADETASEIQRDGLDAKPYPLAPPVEF